MAKQKPQPARLPYKVEFRKPFPDDEISENKNAEGVVDKWLDSIKAQARDNVKGGMESVRIAWANRFKIPKYHSSDEYTPEELLLEVWEQFYYENPESLEMKGINKHTNAKTGYAYYTVGDPVIDALEAAFGRGETPDLEAAFGDITNGPDIFRRAVFYHDNGQVTVPRTGYQSVKENQKGEKINQAGAKIEHDDYTNDAWLKKTLDEDDFFKRVQEKMRSNNA